MGGPGPNHSGPMSKFLLGVIVGVGLVIGGGYWCVTRGRMPVAVTSKPLPFERWIARTSLRAAVGADADKPSPLPADEANLLAGAKIYEARCSGCHGELGHPASAFAKSIFPHAPQLLPPRKGVTDDPVGETYWKVKNGIRLSGMPEFGDSLTDAEMWQVSLMLLHADQLPDSVRQALRRNQ